MIRLYNPDGKRINTKFHTLDDVKDYTKKHSPVPIACVFDNASQPGYDIIDDNGEVWFAKLIEVQ